MENEVRMVSREDLKGLKEVLDSSELFPSHYLDDMIADYFMNPETQAIWFTCITDGTHSAIGYCAPEKFTNGTYNLYAIAVKKELQRKGIGKAMMKFIEEFLRKGEKRILIIDTSSDRQYDLTRKFYKDLNYDLEAVIKDFWNEGEDKITFLKRLQ